LEKFDGIAGLISISFSDFYQKLIDKGAKPVGVYFPEDFAVYLVLDCHNSAPHLVVLCGTFWGSFSNSTTYPA
jgi:hypothetical protein